MGEYFSLLSFLEIEILLHQTILRNSIIHNIVMADRYCKILFDTCLQQMVYLSKSELYKLRHLASQLFPIIVILRTMNYRINSSRQFYSWFRLLNFPHRWQQVIVSHVSKHDAVLERWTIHSSRARPIRDETLFTNKVGRIIMWDTTWLAIPSSGGEFLESLRAKISR